MRSRPKGFPLRHNRLSRDATRVLSTLGLLACTAVIMTGISAPAHAAATVTVTVDCSGPVSFQANVGDTIVFNLTAPGCTYNSAAAEMWNVWNINSDIFPLPAGTGSGFLTYVSGGQAGTYRPRAFSPNDWFVATKSSGTTTITTILASTNDLAEPIQGGEIVGNVNDAYFAHGSMVFYAITWLGPSGSGGSLASSPVARYALNFDANSGTCTTTRTGHIAAGEWIQVPSEEQCSRSGHSLLGWATSPNFPADIAQRQKDHGWGAYELTNDAGGIASVFIPVQGWTEVSGDNTLYAIWGRVK